MPDELEPYRPPQDEPEALIKAVAEEPTPEEMDAEPDFDEAPTDAVAEGRLPDEAPAPDHNSATLRPYV